VLTAVEFEMYFERERSLADRGTRLFSLMVLRRLEGDPLDLDRLSRHLVQRLRSTDLVGQLDRDHVAVLLTDTGPAPAKSIAGWIDRDVSGLGLRVDSTIYVYPTAEEERPAPPDRSAGVDRSASGDRSARGDRSALGGVRISVADVPDVLRTRVPFEGPELADPEGTSNGRTNGAPDGNGHEAPRSPVAHGEAVQAPAQVGANSGMSDSDGKVQDLWPLLSVPTPWWKRAIDMLVAVIALILLFPFFVLIAIAIKLDTPGPVIFRQMRAGRGGRPFVFYKFRSMFVDAEKRRAELEALNEQGGPVFKIRNDPRMTRVGRVMRRWSIDELPQLWNVLKGDFSLVGPRPPTLNEVPGYSRWQRRRLNVAGGLTCIWQVSGRNDIAFEDWMRMDVRYVLRRGFWMDLRLLCRTVSAVVSGRGAY
jgi:lipopolysaccharide/colanic/teichoic acid biosynthesis glycosyltransferase